MDAKIRIFYIYKIYFATFCRVFEGIITTFCNLFEGKYATFCNVFEGEIATFCKVGVGDEKRRRIGGLLIGRFSARCVLPICVFLIAKYDDNHYANTKKSTK